MFTIVLRQQSWVVYLKLYNKKKYFLQKCQVSAINALRFLLWSTFETKSVPENTNKRLY